MKLEMLNDFMIMEKHSIDSKAVCPESGSYWIAGLEFDLKLQTVNH